MQNKNRASWRISWQIQDIIVKCQKGYSEPRGKEGLQIFSYLKHLQNLKLNSPFSHLKIFQEHSTLPYEMLMDSENQILDPIAVLHLDYRLSIWVQSE